MDFYAAASQVIPVLFLAMVFESRALHRQPDSYDPSRVDDPAFWNATQAIGRVYAVVVLAAGEAAALISLYAEGGHGVGEALVWAALAVGIAGTSMPLISRQWVFWRRAWVDGGRRDWQVHLFMVAALVLGTAFWVVLFL